MTYIFVYKSAHKRGSTEDSRSVTYQDMGNKGLVETRPLFGLVLVKQTIRYVCINKPVSLKSTRIFIPTHKILRCVVVF